MQNKTSKKSKLFELRLFPMDTARFFMMLMFPFMRVQKLGLDGKRYKTDLKGGAILAANHTGFSDPLTIGSAFWFRRVYFLAAEALMKNKFIAFWLKQAGCIKIDRNTTDIEAIRNSVSVLKDGKLLLLFPQGQIVQDDSNDKLKSGAVLMALQANVPIIPMYSNKRSHKFGFRRIIIGEPFYCSQYCKKKLPSVAETEQISDLLSQKINECKAVFQKIERN